jgi:hypothetical protein
VAEEITDFRLAKMVGRIPAMEKALPDQLQDVIEALLVAQSKAQLAARTIREQRLHFGLGLNHPDDEITRCISNVRYTKLLAERMASRPVAGGRDRSPEQDVDGRVVSVSDAGDALVVNPVQDATAVPGVVSEGVEGVVVAGDEPVAGAITESVSIPPAILQPPPVDDAPTVEQVTPDEADERPPAVRPDTDGT